MNEDHNTLVIGHVYYSPRDRTWHWEATITGAPDRFGTAFSERAAWNACRAYVHRTRAAQAMPERTLQTDVYDWMPERLTWRSLLTPGRILFAVWYVVFINFLCWAYLR